MSAPLSLSGPASRSTGPAEFAAISMVEVELSQPLPTVLADGRSQRVWVLVRLLTEPIGTCIVDVADGEVSSARFGEILWGELGEAISQRFAAAGLPPPSRLRSSGFSVDPESWPFLRTRSEALKAAPSISVVVCTYNRPDRLQVCLQHLGRQQYPAFEVVVVDNNPQTDAARVHVESLGDPRFRYVAEPRVGLSRARNAGVSVASGDVLAFVDDDEEPDDYWLAELARGFARDGDVGCVTGLILPARLDSEAQLLFEELGGHSKERGFAPAIFSRGGPQSPLFPRPPFGAGGNMAFRRETLAKIGRFDTALGAGTPALGAEDTLALTLVLLTGYKIAYEPAAFVRHHHYRDCAGLARQLHGYSVGLTAFYAALIRRRPWTLIGLVKLLPDATRYLAASRSAAVPAPSGMRPELTSGRVRGMLAGPAAYLRGIVRNVSSDARQAWSSRKRRSSRHGGRRA